MFLFFAIIGAIGSMVLFGGMISTGFEDFSVITAFVSMLFNTILCLNLARIAQKVSDNEDEIEKLKSHLGIKDGDPVNQNKNSKNY